jgi:hypothetical protein
MTRLEPSSSRTIRVDEAGVVDIDRIHQRKMTIGVKGGRRRVVMNIIHPMMTMVNVIIALHLIETERNTTNEVAEREMIVITKSPVKRNRSTAITTMKRSTTSTAVNVTNITMIHSDKRRPNTDPNWYLSER